MGPGTQQRDRHIVGTQVIFVANKQKLNKRISSTVTVVENKKETSSGRQGVGTGASGAWEGGDRKGSSQQKPAQAQQACSCLGQQLLKPDV